MTLGEGSGRDPPRSSSGQRKGREKTDKKPTKFALDGRSRMLFCALTTLSLMTALDGTSISVALPIISSDIGATSIQAFWTGTSFLLCSAAFQPLFGSFSDHLGRRLLVWVGISLFLVGACVAGTAHNTTLMIVGRCFQGAGGGGIMTLTGLVIADAVPLRHRGTYFGLFSAMWSLGSVLGPVIGGAFAKESSWRWIFYINFPFIGLGAALVGASCGSWPRIDHSFRNWRKQVDFIGAALFTTSITSFLVPLTWGGITYEWDSWHTIVPLSAGAAGLCVFAGYEYRMASRPLIPPSLFGNRTSTISFVGYTITGILLWSNLYYLPLYYEGVKGFSPLLSGIAMFPNTFTVAPSAMIVGLLIAKTGNYKWSVICGWILCTLGMGLLCLLEIDTNTATWIFVNIVGGIGLGAIIPSVAFAVQASASAETLSMAVAMSTFFRTFGQTLGVAIGGVIFQNRMRTNLSRYPGLSDKAVEYSQDVIGIVDIINGLEEGPQKHALKVAYVDSLRTIWAFCCGISGIALALSLFTHSYDLDREMVTVQAQKGTASGKHASLQIPRGGLICANDSLERPKSL
ncbi:hypothetical protein N7507_000798 [Penicillium longicatenatum]|nr:hypothetical protein N7507_000798 [Penicillium longicatenatum]